MGVVVRMSRLAHRQAGSPADAGALVGLASAVGAEPEGWLLADLLAKRVATSGET